MGVCPTVPGVLNGEVQVSLVSRCPVEIVGHCQALHSYLAGYVQAALVRKANLVGPVELTEYELIHLEARE